MIHFVTTRAGTFGIRDFVELHAPALAEALDVLHYEDLPDRTRVPSGTYIFSALDQLTPGGRRLVGELAKQLQHPGAHSRVLNDPARVLLRYELLETLHRQGFNAHRAVRAAGKLADLRFPVFLREESQHTGSLSTLLFDHPGLERALGRALLQGYQLAELLVVEFCETADTTGKYHRYSAFVVSSTIVARELMVGRNWMLNSDTNEPTEQMLLEERAYVLGNPHERELSAIFALACVEYGRIDYAVRDGRVETWEINLNPTIRRGRLPDATPLPQALDVLREVARRHSTDAIAAALRSVDVGIPVESVPLRYSETSLRHTTPMVHSPQLAWHGGLARLLHRAAPLLGRMTPWLASLVARAARRRHDPREPRQPERMQD